jgi:hypothetical protein
VIVRYGSGVTVIGEVVNVPVVKPPPDAVTVLVMLKGAVGDTVAVT